ncbi:MAG: DNA-binding transcriptional regulator Fis [Lysobacteraceae bacterium]|nr:MAG: DNA-binding transcriptional regulator Fis [Xanthomonadaceae bacterium]
MNAQYAARAESPSHAAGHTPLRDHVARSVRRYLQDINGCGLDDLYEVVLREVEAPLFAEVMRYCEGNQSRAAACLGINRATLRKKLKSYDLA